MNILDKIAFIIWASEWGVSEAKEKRIDYLIEKWENDFMTEINSEHYGDCIQVPCTCIRCYMENVYSVANMIYKKLFENF